MWDNLQASRLIEEFGRREPETLSHAPAPTKAQIDTLFAEPLTKCTVDSGGTPDGIAAQSQMQKWLEDIANVATDESFVGYTPASEQELAAEVQLMRVLFRTGEWHEVDNAWQAGLLPEGQLVRRKSDSLTAIVLRSYAAAALLWPAKQVAMRLWTADLEVQELRWVVCFDIVTFEVIPCGWASPLHLILEVTIIINHARDMWHGCTQS